MTDPVPPNSADEAVLDLLIKRATEGLTPDEQRELDVLDDASTTRDLHDIERAVAAATLAGIAPLQQPPAALLARLQTMAAEHVTAVSGAVSSAPASGSSLSTPPIGTPPISTPPSATVHTLPTRSQGVRGGSGGWWAAAACLILAAFGWLRSPAPVGPALPAAPAEPPPTAVVDHPPPVPVSIEEQRAKMLAQASSIKVQLGATKDPAAAGVTGDVVWDPATQQGFLHFVGLAPNDPALRQYQAWIFDGERDQRYPIDVGLFDVPADAREVFIPIHAAVPVRVAAAFAVTVEKAGGAVVSGREHVVALGKAG